MLHDSDRTLAILQQLHDLQVGISMDDFGKVFVAQLPAEVLFR